MDEDIDPISLELRDNPSSRIEDFLTDENARELAAELDLRSKNSRELKREIERRLRHEDQRR